MLTSLAPPVAVESARQSLAPPGFEGVIRESRVKSNLQREEKKPAGLIRARSTTASFDAPSSDSVGPSYSWGLGRVILVKCVTADNERAYPSRQSQRRKDRRPAAETGLDKKQLPFGESEPAPAG